MRGVWWEVEVALIDERVRDGEVHGPHELRHRLTEGRLKLINRIAGGVLIAFGVVLLFNELVLGWV